MNILETSQEAKSRIDKGITDLFSKCLKPPPKLDLVEWADTYRMLPAESSSEAGKWKTDRVIAAKEPMLSVSDPTVAQVTIQACTQLAKTELVLNAIGYFIHQEPSPIIVMQPKKEMAEAFSKDRLTPMCRDTPALKEAFSTNRRDTGNTILHKQFAGGQITMVGSNSPSDLAMRPCRIVLCDEVDKYPASAGDEGDPISLLWERAATFGKKRKLITVCSPTVEGKSRIEKEYLASDQRVFQHLCKHCDEHVALEWENVNIPRDEKTGIFDTDKAAIACPECGSEWSEQDRVYSIRNHKWQITNPSVKNHHGYRISKFASPWEDIPELAAKFVRAKDDIERLKTFYNTQMARTWKEKGDQPDWKRLYDRRENYKIGQVPEGGLMITCGIDVQKAYLAYEVVAWGRKKESWSIEKGAIEGSIEEQGTKEKLAQFLDTVYTSKDGIDMPIERAGLDSGYNTQEVYSFIRWYGSERVVAVKGDDGLKTIIGTPRPVDINLSGKKINRGIMLWGVGSSVIKEQVYRWLNLESLTDEEKAAGRETPTGFCHFPEYDEEFFKQLTAEQYIQQTDNRGFSKYIWEKLRKDNHFLDCRVYARAASAMLQIDRMSDGDWKARESMLTPKLEEQVSDTYIGETRRKPTDTDSGVSKDASQTVDRTGRTRRKSSWIQR